MDGVFHTNSTFYISASAKTCLNAQRTRHAYTTLRMLAQFGKGTCSLLFKLGFVDSSECTAHIMGGLRVSRSYLSLNRIYQHVVYYKTDAYHFLLYHNKSFK